MDGYIETASDTAFTVFIATCEASMRTNPDRWLANQIDQIEAARHKQQINSAASELVARDRHNRNRKAS